MYISSCKHPIQISTVQSEEQHVMNLLSKFHQNRTVNESGNAVLRKLRKLENFVAPSAQKIENQSLAPGSIEATPGSSCCAKSTKNSFFVQCSRRLAEPPLPPGGSSQKKPRIGLKFMRRLAAHSMPPGGFWGFSRNA